MEAMYSQLVFHPPRPLLTQASAGIEEPAPTEGVDRRVDALCTRMARATGGPCVVYAPSRTLGDLKVLLLHGNAENVVSCGPLASQLAAALGAPTYVPEWPGYWAGAPPASEGGTLATSRAAMDALILEGHPVLVVGYSLGSAAALHAACGVRPGAPPVYVALVAPLLSALATQLGRSSGTARLSFLYAPFDAFRTEGLARSLSVPALVIHGARDDVVPPAHGKRLSELARAVFKEVADADHDTVRLGVAATVAEWLDPLRGSQ